MFVIFNLWPFFFFVSVWEYDHLQKPQKFFGWIIGCVGIVSMKVTTPFYFFSTSFLSSPSLWNIFDPLFKDQAPFLRQKFSCNHSSPNHIFLTALSSHTTFKWRINRSFKMFQYSFVLTFIFFYIPSRPLPQLPQNCWNEFTLFL